MDNKKEKTTIPNPKLDIPFVQAADITTAAVQKSESIIHKKIYWDYNDWHCEELIVRVFKDIPGRERLPYDLDPVKTNIEITDSKNWLEIKAIKQADDGKSIVVEIKLREGVDGDIRPPDSSEIEKKRVSDAPEDKLMPIASPAINIGTTLTIKVSIDLDTSVIKTVGDTPYIGGPDPIVLGRKKIKLPPEHLPYLVIPPVVKWAADYKEMIKLDGTKENQSISLVASGFPVAWISDADITLTIPTEKINNLFVKISEIDEGKLEIMRKSLRQGSSNDNALIIEDPLRPIEDYLDRNRRKVFYDHYSTIKEIIVDLKLASSKLIVKPVREIFNDGAPSVSTVIPLKIGTSSPYLGKQEVIVDIDALALEVSVYFGGEPAGDYFTNSKERFVRVIKNTKDALEKIPIYASLKAELRTGFDCNIKHLLWTITHNESSLDESEANMNTTLDDKFLYPHNTETAYIAPNEIIWKEHNKPNSRLVHCRIGSDEEDSALQGENNLYYTKIIEHSIFLADPLREAYLKVKIGPEAFMTGDKLNHLDKNITESMIREFIIDLDLEDIAWSARNANKFSKEGDVD